MQTIFFRAYALPLIIILLLAPNLTAASHVDGVASNRAASYNRAAQKRRARKRAATPKRRARAKLTPHSPQEAFQVSDTISGRRLDGTFIQFWGNRVRQQWQQVLTTMYDAGMRTIILQYLKNRVMKRDGTNKIIYGSDQCPVMDEAVFTYTDSYTMPNGDVIIDPTEFILDFADKKGMDVYVGLINDERFVADEQWNNPRCLNLPQQIDDNKRFAEAVWGRYGKKHGAERPRPSFKGWYLPQEMWNEPYTDEQIRDFRAFFGAVSKRCKDLSGSLPVAVSPFFNPNLLGAEAFAETYGRFLRSGGNTAGIDIVMLQDSVGAKGIPYDDILTKVGGYDRAMRDRLDGLGVKFWANVESFESEPGRPTEFSRLERQIETARGHVAQDEKIVTFDFYHYMNPFGYDHANNASYVAAERLLYCEYLKRYVPNATLPQGVICSP